VARARAGDRAAQGELVLRYQERLLRIVRVRLGPGGAGLRRYLESADVVQDTWKAALGGIQDLRVEGDAQILGWLARIATNQVRDRLDHARAARRALDREQALGEATAGEPADSAHGPRSEAEHAELAEILDASLAELPEDYREAILLRDYCGADWESIAERLERGSVHAAQQLHQRAWIKLRRQAGPRLRGGRP
jgi:RNA polymerase sigma-70 factor (ECF subfamily)